VRILFLDRDGTLNRSIGSRPPNIPEEVELLPGVASVLSDYVVQGWLIVIVSNQGGVASGYISERGAHAVQQRVVELLPVPVAESYLCPHMAGGRVTEYAIDCPNRKPRPGFLTTALERFGAQAEACLFVGDSSTDEQAAQAAGVPFRGADLFFGRSIERGILMPNGHWVQVRQAKPQEWAALSALVESWAEHLPQPEAVGQAGNLALIARDRSAPLGWLSLTRGQPTGQADLAFGVDPAHLDRAAGGLGEGAGVGALLLESALDWAQAQSGLERLCVQVRADNLPVSRLCCRYGFGDLDQRQRRKRPRLAAPQARDRDGWIQLDCAL
jgi:D-glycero-D-manno-heptose 1,7-bisphosphate phosphatase